MEMGLCLLGVALENMGSGLSICLWYFGLALVVSMHMAD